MQKAALVFIPYGAFTVLESFIPIAVEAAARGVPCFTLIIGERPAQVIESAGVFSRMLARYTRVFHFVANAGFFRRGIGLSRLIAVLTYLRLTHRKLIIVYTEKNTSAPFDSLMNWLCGLFGRPVAVKPNQGVLTEVHLRRYVGATGRKFFEEEMRARGRPRRLHSPESRLAELFHNGQRWILFTDEERAALETALNGSVPGIVIGIPRLYSSWPEAMRTVCQPLLREELKSLKISTGTPVVVFAPTDIHCAWVRDAESNMRMLRWLVQAVRGRMPGAVIVVKPKPRFRTAYEALIREIDGDDVRLSMVPLPVWALGASVAVVVSPSAAVFEFLCMAVPTIELSDYPHWFAPYSYPWAGTPGLLLAGTAEELEQRIAEIGSTAKQGPAREALAAHFGHNDHLFERLLEA